MQKAEKLAMHAAAVHALIRQKVLQALRLATLAVLRQLSHQPAIQQTKTTSAAQPLACSCPILVSFFMETESSGNSN